MKLVLASQSPRRQALLERLEIEFTVHAANVPETIIAGESPAAACQRLAREKALAVAHEYPNDLVIGADTMVILDGRILGKPVDDAAARQMLNDLSGNEHEVITGVALVRLSENHDSVLVESTAVRFHRLTQEVIDYYVDNHHPLDKAGAYGIQDWSGIFVAGITGCYHNVVGLPLARLYEQLIKYQFVPRLTSRKHLII